CFKGGSTAKLSLLAELAGRELVVFDSFEGLPDNDESGQVTIQGEVSDFRKGRYLGRLDEVRDNVRRFGAVDRCRFVKGWFEDTMPGFDEPVLAAFVDVDLVSSTRTYLKTLFPLLQPSGSVFPRTRICPALPPCSAARASGGRSWAGMHRGSTGWGSRSWCGFGPESAADWCREGRRRTLEERFSRGTVSISTARRWGTSDQEPLPLPFLP